MRSFLRLPHPTQLSTPACIEHWGSPQPGLAPQLLQRLRSNRVVPFRHYRLLRQSPFLAALRKRSTPSPIRLGPLLQLSPAKTLYELPKLEEASRRAFIELF
jgi:hypothetical protein